MLISSQRYLDQDLVDAKCAAEDFVVTYYDLSDEYRVVIDGHHSLAAARQAGVDPQYVSAGAALVAEYDYTVGEVGVEGWLEQHYHDSDWYDVATGHSVF